MATKKPAKRKPRSVRVFVGTDDGGIYPWTASTRRRDCRLYITEWLGDGDWAKTIKIKRASLTLDPPKKARKP